MTRTTLRSPGPVRARRSRWPALAGLALAAALLGCASTPDEPPPDWQRVRSPLGFSISLPPNWLVVSSESVRENANLFATAFDDERSGLNPRLKQQLLERIRSGSVEYYFRQETLASGFSENISVQRRRGRVPEPEAICPDLEPQLARQLGRDVDVVSCGSREIGGREMLVAEVDGTFEGVLSVMYQIPEGDDEVLSFTATLQRDNRDLLVPRVERILATLEPE